MCGRIRWGGGRRGARLELVRGEARGVALGREGVDPRYGARPLRRVIERRVTAPLAARLAQWAQGPEGPARAESTPAHARGARIDALLDARGAAVFRMTPGAGGSAGGAERAAQTMEIASELRATVQRWSRSPLAASLRSMVTAFDRASRMPDFWTDPQRVERASMRATAARASLSALDEALAQALATEDLSFEVYFTRTPEAIAALAEVFVELRQRVERARHALFMALSPPIGSHPSTVLYLHASRTEWRWLRWLRDSYLARAAGLDVRPEAVPYTPLTLPTNKVV